MEQNLQIGGGASLHALLDQPQEAKSKVEGVKCFLLVGNLRKEILSHERKTNSTALIGENDTHFLECHLPKFNRGSARRDRDWSTALPTDG